MAKVSPARPPCKIIVWVFTNDSSCTYRKSCIYNWLPIVPSVPSVPSVPNLDIVSKVVVTPCAQARAQRLKKRHVVLTMTATAATRAGEISWLSPTIRITWTILQQQQQKQQQQQQTASRFCPLCCPWTQNSRVVCANTLPWSSRTTEANTNRNCPIPLVILDGYHQTNWTHCIIILDQMGFFFGCTSPIRSHKRW